MAQYVRVLCVDDDPDVLASLKAQLRGRFDVLTAAGGEAGLALLAENSDVAVVVSDMRMPGMDGVEFLRQVRSVSPDTVRILLTGQADLYSTIDAVNEGQIFRFLTKPSTVAALRIAVDDAAEQYRLVTSERVLLEQTLHGSINALTDALSLASPLAFGRAMRVKQLVSELVTATGMRERWQVEVAAMFSQLAWITLPIEVVEKQYYGHALTKPEKAMVDRLPAVTEQLVSHIPRLEVVREMVIGAASTAMRVSKLDPVNAKLAARGAQLLRLAIAFDDLDARGTDAETALSILTGRDENYDPAALTALAEIKGRPSYSQELREVPIAGLHSGMVLLDDVKLRNGMLLVSRGSAITPGLLERIRNLPRGSVHEPLRVRVPAHPPA